jgi:hypothetical protein
MGTVGKACLVMLCFRDVQSVYSGYMRICVSQKGSLVINPRAPKICGQEVINGDAYTYLLTVWPEVQPCPPSLCNPSD